MLCKTTHELYLIAYTFSWLLLTIPRKYYVSISIMKVKVNIQNKDLKDIIKALRAPGLEKLQANNRLLEK